MEPVLFIPPSWPRSRSAWGAKTSSTLARPRAVKWLSRLMPEPSSRWMAAARPRAASISFATWSDFSRLTGPPQAVCADLQEDLVGDVVVRYAEQLDQDLRKATRLSVNVGRPQSHGYESGRDLALHAAA